MEDKIKSFLHWLDYEHDLCEYYGGMSVEDLKNSHRIFSNKLAELIEELGYSSYDECIEGCVEHDRS